MALIFSRPRSRHSHWPNGERGQASHVPKSWNVLENNDIGRFSDKAGASADNNTNVEAANSPLLGVNKPTPTELCCSKFRWSRRKSWAVMFLGVIAIICGLSIHYSIKEMSLDQSWKPDTKTVLFSKKPLPRPRNDNWITNFTLPLRTSGRNIVDTNGDRFKLASINWYGASDELMVPGGLDIQHRDIIADTIKRLGFNSVRMPYADELVMRNPTPDSQHVKANPDLIGMPAMDVYHKVVKSLTDAGIAVIVNNHITQASWCCGANPCDSGWANNWLGIICPVSQTEEEWIQHWETIMRPLVSNDLVIGVDLRNEVRGLWGTMPWSRWAMSAEKCGNRLLRMKKDWLVVVEGTESANDLSGAKERPIKLDQPNRIVYSAHVYAWSGWGSWEGRYLQRGYESFAREMRDNWAYLVQDNIAPVWVGELGASRNSTVGGANYWQNLMQFLRSVDADFGYWALNPRKPNGNVSESYALVEDDWVTPVLDYRMKDMVGLMED